MQKAERLLDLAAFLLRAAEPVAWREIQEQFPDDYGGSEEAAIRKFERDKAELLEIGIPVRSAALAQGAFPYAKDLAHALNKLSFAARAPGASETAALAARQLSSDGEAPGYPGAGGPLARKLEELSSAVMTKKRVHLVYQGAERGAATERDVDPYGLYQSGGAWFVVGHCHLRKDLRTFHLARISELKVNAAAPRSRDFTVPEGFSLGTLATRETWEYAVHAPERCTVRLEAPVSPEARASFGPRAVKVP